MVCGDRAVDTVGMDTNSPPAGGTATLRRHPRHGIDARVAEWETAGLLTHEQAEAITTYEASRPVPATNRFGRLVTVVTVLGALLVGAGVMLSVGSNWEAMPDWSKLAVLVLAVVGFEYGGWRLRAGGRAPRVGGGLVLAGYLLYGAGIHLVAQTYHRPLDDPLLMLLWFLPGLPLAHALRSPAVLLGSVGVGYFALLMQTVRWFDGVIDTGLVVIGLFMATAAALLGAGVALERSGTSQAPLGRAYRFAGAVSVLVLLYGGGFRWVYDEFGRVSLPEAAALWVGLAASVALGSLVLMILRVPVGRRRAAAADSAMVIVALAVAARWLAGAPAPSLAAAAVANLALLGAVVWLIAVGLLERREALVNVAVAVFGLALFSRYLEIGMGMLGTGFSFIGTGLVLLGIGYGLEKVRRGLLAHMEEVDDAV